MTKHVPKTRILRTVRHSTLDQHQFAGFAAIERALPGGSRTLSLLPSPVNGMRRPGNLRSSSCHPAVVIVPSDMVDKAPKTENSGAPEDDPVASKRRLIIALLAVLFAGIGSVAFGFMADQVFGGETWQEFVLENFELVAGTPMAAALAFVIVMVFFGGIGGPVKIKIGILELSGPAGPILLWVICFLVVVFAITLLSNSL